MRFPGILLALCLSLPAAPTAAAAVDWTPIGPDGGVVRALTAAPSRPAVLYAGTQAGGVFKSVDRARTWSFTGLRGSWTYSLAVDPKNPETVYAGGDRGLLKSTDGGATWRSAGLELPGSTVVLVKIHPARPAIVFASVDRRLYRTADRGRTWTVEPGSPEGVGALSFVPGRPNLLYAGADEGVWKSQDSGRTWNRISTGISFVTVIAIDPRTPRILYAGSLSQGFLKSTDGGATWSLPRTLGDGSPITSITIDPATPSRVYASEAGRVFRSQDHGETWSRMDTGLPGSVIDLVVTRYGLLAGSLSGVFLSPDRALTWRIASHGIAASPVIQFAVSPQEPPRLYAFSTLGFFKSEDRGQTWQRPPGAQGLYTGLPHPIAIDPTDPETLYTGDFQTVVKSTDGGQSWTAAGSLACVVPVRIVLDPRTPSTLYSFGTLATPHCGPPGACTFARSRTAGATWDCLAAPGLLLDVDPFTSVVYTEERKDLLRSTDEGTTWTTLFPGLDAAFFAFLPSFVPSPLVPGTLWAGRVGAVGRSRDGGQTWQFFSTGLPSVGMVALALDPSAPETLYAGTQTDGVFRSTDAGETWTRVGNWPAGVILQSGLAVDPADPSLLYAGTDIAGVLRLDQEE